MEQHDGHLGIGADEILQVGRRGPGQCDVVVTESCVELEGLFVAGGGVADEGGSAVDDQVVQAGVLQALEATLGQ